MSPLLRLVSKDLLRNTHTGHAITGPQLAALLEILVTAANEGSLAEVSELDSADEFVIVSDLIV